MWLFVVTCWSLGTLLFTTRDWIYCYLLLIIIKYLLYCCSLYIMPVITIMYTFTHLHFLIVCHPLYQIYMIPTYIFFLIFIKCSCRGLVIQNPTLWYRKQIFSWLFVQNQPFTLTFSSFFQMHNLQLEEKLIYFLGLQASICETSFFSGPRDIYILGFIISILSQWINRDVGVGMFDSRKLFLSPDWVYQKDWVPQQICIQCLVFCSKTHTSRPMQYWCPVLWARLLQLHQKVCIFSAWGEFHIWWRVRHYRVSSFSSLCQR